MELFLLGGNSKANKDWIEIVAEYLRDDFQKCSILYYDHWSRPDVELINLEKETQRLLGMTAGKKGYVIFAKSAGCIVALQALNRGMKPEKCVFAGLPLSWAQMMHIDMHELVTNAPPIPFIFVQNKNDPAASAEALKTFLKAHALPKMKLVILDADNHDYLDIISLKQEIVT